ncbi:MAG TPA: tRNA 2-selenouridine(34) synthase MnmH [Paracoccaceae bacterium]|nr:tRNA 2-selenouridine(34) synthase MnmH [Paracoccaceae bacterium]HMO71998.1 tRNA 2-selenouridine(34) synthase MnmH [Paracoccaceae bacterium]
MPLSLTSLLDPLDAGFDDLIDVRAPAEFADDHVPGAVSLPVLSDAERARVGTIYKQVSPFDARKIGAALVARNTAAHLETALADRPGGWQPLVYCWRGGQRSGSFATILRAIGWRVETIEGGYKAWRRLVVQALETGDGPPRAVALDGDTGSGKTAILAALATRGVQVIDLEALAGHRGSVFGGDPGAQPSQKTFEAALAVALARLDPARPVVIEAESPMIGRLRLPPAVLRLLARAPRVEIAAPRAARVAHVLATYPDMGADPAGLAGLIDRLRPWQPREVIEHWQAQAGAGDLAGLAAGLMERHYDPLYARSRVRRRPAAAVVGAGPLDGTGIAALAEEVAALVERLEG